MTLSEMTFFKEQFDYDRMLCISDLAPGIDIVPNRVSFVCGPLGRMSGSWRANFLVERTLVEVRCQSEMWPLTHKTLALCDRLFRDKVIQSKLLKLLSGALGIMVSLEACTVTILH